ncbi:hypothetical protein F7230_07795 [Corynebacterium sp. 320]|uniref:type II secretion system F family protein n=1 Tax=Corynebacterium TaxID=1716 RepID=UPI00125CC88A|nr:MULTISPECIES: type II secretion system F family protein [Corynebacterium]KAB1502885.1 hypothetical protein F7230_07795 [Corynebacterium sp. 320]KAB1552396.1 hypothetical protein F7233_01115 [Corynebacterium sp. 321]KAB1554389.1 hypothetical protein F7232_05480 [Corynebacterium sp. 319]KAB3526548.1 hypothetical protein F8354_07795 [Corynebacterium sp. 250]KAB3539868.1 hypothetical protein F8390_00850 [Corynebacterium sp. 366]
MTVLIWMFCASLWGYVGWKVGRRIVDDRGVRQGIDMLLEFARLVARDCHAGARIPTAVHAACSTMQSSERAQERGQELAHRMRTTACIHEMGGAIDPADGGGEAEQRFLVLWALAAEHGIGLGDLLDTFCRDLEARLAHHSKTHSAMGGARLTVVVLLSLPPGAVILGQSLGLGTVSFYTQSILGSLFGLVGTLLACAGVLWAEALTATVLGGVGRRAGPHDPTGAARVLDLVAAALRAGAPLVHAWELAVSTSAFVPEEDGSHSTVRAIPALLHLGAGASAWEQLAEDPFYGPIARMAAQQSTSGAMLADAMAHHAEYLRKLSLDKATEAAEKMLVVLAAPLTLCFLPAFVVTGLIPLALGLAGL